MNAVPNPPRQLAALARRGIVLTVAPSGALQVQPASQLTEDERKWLRANAATVLVRLREAAEGAQSAGLTGNEPWDDRVALALMDAAVDGSNPAIRDAAAMVNSAFAARDLETLRFACAEFMATVRGLLAARARLRATG
jgi:hypothetical protein